MENYPKIGVGVIIRKGNKVLLGKRIGSHGSNTWSFPGGGLEYREKVFDCAIRENSEESGVEIGNLQLTTYTENFFEDVERHDITLFVIADYISGEPKILEPKKCLAWEWFTWDNLPEPLFLPVKNLKEKNFNPFKI